MDEIDLKIIEILNQDARIPFTKIAQTVGIGKDGVIRRYKKLLRKGVISKPIIVLDSKICGFAGCVDYYIKIKPGNDVDETLAQLAKISNIVLISKTLGDIDLFCGGFFTNFNDLIQLTQTVTELDGIHSMDVSLYVNDDWTIPIDYNIIPSLCTS